MVANDTHMSHIPPIDTDPQQHEAASPQVVVARPNLLQSELLTLVASTATHVRTELEAPEQLAHLLGAVVSPEWPSGEYDHDAMVFFLSCFEAGGDSAEGWYAWYALSPDGGSAPRTLLGAGGYFGPPDADGTVEIGYSILPEWQRRGYASEMVKMLAAHAFTFSQVNRVLAHTAEGNSASIKVLVRSGFHPAGAGAEAGTLRFECTHVVGT